MGLDLALDRTRAEAGGDGARRRLRRLRESAGVARFPADASDVETLIATAKDGLARARADGRGTAASGVAPAG